MKEWPVKNAAKHQFERSRRLGELPQNVPMTQNTVLQAFKCAEEYLIQVMKVVSIGALLVALVLIEAGFVKRVWETEFSTERLPSSFYIPAKQKVVPSIPRERYHGGAYPEWASDNADELAAFMTRGLKDLDSAHTGQDRRSGTAARFIITPLPFPRAHSQRPRSP